MGESGVWERCCWGLADATCEQQAARERGMMNNKRKVVLRHAHIPIIATPLGSLLTPNVGQLYALRVVEYGPKHMG